MVEAHCAYATINNRLNSRVCFWPFLLFFFSLHIFHTYIIIIIIMKRQNWRNQNQKHAKKVKRKEKKNKHRSCFHNTIVVNFSTSCYLSFSLKRLKIEILLYSSLGCLRLISTTMYRLCSNSMSACVCVCVL